MTAHKWLRTLSPELVTQRQIYEIWLIVIN